MDILTTLIHRCTLYRVTDGGRTTTRVVNATGVPCHVIESQAALSRLYGGDIPVGSGVANFLPGADIEEDDEIGFQGRTLRVTGVRDVWGPDGLGSSHQEVNWTEHNA